MPAVVQWKRVHWTRPYAPNADATHVDRALDAAIGLSSRPDRCPISAIVLFLPRVLTRHEAAPPRVRRVTAILPSADRHQFPLVAATRMKRRARRCRLRPSRRLVTTSSPRRVCGDLETTVRALVPLDYRDTGSRRRQRPAIESMGAVGARHFTGSHGARRQPSGVPACRSTAIQCVAARFGFEGATHRGLDPLTSPAGIFLRRALVLQQPSVGYVQFAQLLTIRTQRHRRGAAEETDGYFSSLTCRLLH